MTSYAIRVSKSHMDMSGVYEKFDASAKIVVAYEHPDEGNVHCHILLLECTVSTDTLKNYIRKVVGQVERTQWSFKSGADKDFIAYMSKGKYDSVHMYGIAPDEISIYKAKGYDKATIRLEGGKLVRPIKEGLKKTKRELIEIMRANINPDASYYDIIKGIRKVLIQNNEVIGSYKVIDFVDAYMMYANESRWLDNVVGMYERRMAR